MNTYQALALTCGVCCFWPLLCAGVAVAVDRRVRDRGWSSLLPRKERIDEP